MNVNFLCSSCGQQLNAPAAKAGAKAKCPKCGSAVVVPTPSGSADDRRVVDFGSNRERPSIAPPGLSNSESSANKQLYWLFIGGAALATVAIATVLLVLLRDTGGDGRDDTATTMQAHDTSSGTPDAGENPAAEPSQEAKDAFMRGANAEIIRNDLDEAIRHFSEAVRLAPEFANAYHCRGNAHYAKGEMEKAIADWTEAVRLDLKDDVSYVNRGMAYANKGEFDKAIDDFGKAIKLSPNDGANYYYRGRAYQKVHERAKAESDLAKARELGHEPE